MKMAVATMEMPDSSEKENGKQNRESGCCKGKDGYFYFERTEKKEVTCHDCKNPEKED
jgi:hypothetical protein